MSHKNLIITYFFFSICVVNAQVGGENVYQFLNLSTSARQIALGGETFALLEDVNQPIYNPSVISNKIDNKISVNYTSYLAGVNIGSLSFAKTISRRFGTIHGSIKYLDYGSLIGADEKGNENGNFNASDIAVSVGYAFNLPWTNIFMGSNIRFINSNIANFSSTAISTDFAIPFLCKLI